MWCENHLFTHYINFALLMLIHIIHPGGNLLINLIVNFRVAGRFPGSYQRALRQIGQVSSFYQANGVPVLSRILQPGASYFTACISARLTSDDLAIVAWSCQMKSAKRLLVHVWFVAAACSSTTLLLAVCLNSNAHQSHIHCVTLSKLGTPAIKNSRYSDIYSLA